MEALAGRFFDAACISYCRQSQAALRAFTALTHRLYGPGVYVMCEVTFVVVAVYWFGAPSGTEQPSGSPVLYPVHYLYVKFPHSSDSAVI
jgi:hypothetical protein